MIFAIPVKPFELAKGRLSSALDDTARHRLGVELARRTADTIARAGARPVVISADDPVTAWARSAGLDVILDPGSGLDQAARTAVEFAGAEPWVITHADLPLLTVEDVADVVGTMASGRPVIAPSSDAGTSMIGHTGRFDFRFGQGSFHRHLASLATSDPRVVTRLGTLLDLDTRADLEAAKATVRGRWLTEFLG